MKTYLLSSLSLFFVLSSHSAKADMNVQLSWEQPARADSATEQFILSRPQVGSFNLANTQESLDAFCNQIAEEAKRSLKLIGFPHVYKGVAQEKSGPSLSAGAFIENKWDRVSNSEIVVRILCQPIK
ncbi:MAG: hypothetical protein ACXVCE_14130 [Bacteriovorax sp.]